jgi:hypothetical protein
LILNNQKLIKLLRRSYILITHLFSPYCCLIKKIPKNLL